MVNKNVVTKVLLAVCVCMMITLCIIPASADYKVSPLEVRNVGYQPYLGRVANNSIDGDTGTFWQQENNCRWGIDYLEITLPQPTHIDYCLVKQQCGISERMYIAEPGWNINSSGTNVPNTLASWTAVYANLSDTNRNKTSWISISMPEVWNCLNELECYTTDSPDVVADFEGSPLSGPAPLYVQFSDTSTNTDGTTVYNWTITPTTGVVGYSGSAKDHFAYFTAPGNYSISHGVEGPAGSDIEDKTDYITVYSPTTDYATTGFVAMDKPRWIQLAGATINLFDVGNGTWSNTTSSTTGLEYITTRTNSTINAYASMAGYYDIQLLGKAPWDGGFYTIEMLPTGYANVSAGDITLYVTIWGYDGVSSRLSGAAVNRVYIADGQQVADYRITDSSGIVSFVVPNQTLIYLYAEKAGYTKGGTTINSGTGNGGDAAVYADITLQKQYVTTAPTTVVTTLPGGGTPTTQQTVDPYPCDADHPENCQRKQTDLANTVIVWAPDLVNLFILATIFGVFTMMMKGIK